MTFWRQTGEDGEIRYDLTDPEWNTRFLGDLYQDLSEAARKTYALLQTPGVRRGVHPQLHPRPGDRGVRPGTRAARRPRGPAARPARHRPGLRVGHFLLGAFRRLLSAWETASPTTDRYELVAKALSSVHGVDKNPFAAAIARFRLMLAAMRAAGVERLTERVDFPINIAVGDSLLHGKGAPGRQGEFDFGGESRRVDLPHRRRRGLHQVLPHPRVRLVPRGGREPAIHHGQGQGRERELSARHTRAALGSTHLSVPFAERIFQLAAIRRRWRWLHRPDHS